MTCSSGQRAIRAGTSARPSGSASPRQVAVIVRRPDHQIVPGAVTRRCPPHSPAGPLSSPFTRRCPVDSPDVARFIHQADSRRARTVVAQGDPPIVGEAALRTAGGSGSVRIRRCPGRFSRAVACSGERVVTIW
jgi:hypothetical protein